MAGTYDFTLDQGGKFYRSLIYKNSQGEPVDLTDYTARMQIRREIADTDIVHSLSTDTNGGITITGSAGKVELSIPATITKNFSFKTAYYGLVLIPPAPAGEGDAFVLLTGKITLIAGVTR